MSIFNKFALNKKIKYNTYSAIMIIGITAVLLGVNYFVHMIDKNHNLSVDMTTSRIYSLGSVTKDMLDRLDKDIFIYTTETAGIEDANVEQLLKNYASASNKIHVINIDIIKNPSSIEQYNDMSDFAVTAGCIIVSNSPDTTNSNQRYRILCKDSLYALNPESGEYDEFSAEDAISGAIKYITEPNNQKVWLLDNHNPDGMANLNIKNILENENYQVSMLNILNGENPLGKGDVVIVLSPESDLTPAERDILDGFLDDGGRMIIAVNSAMNASSDFENLSSLAGRYNIRMEQGVIIESDLSCVAVTDDRDYVYSFIIPEIVSHEITNDFLLGDYKLLLGMNPGEMILPEKVNNPDVKIEPLLMTSDTSFIEPWSNDMDNKADYNARYGEFAVMAAVTERAENQDAADTKLIILTAPELFTHAQSYSQNIYKNKDFLIKSIAWLTDSHGDAGIMSKPLRGAPLMLGTMKQAYFIITLVSVVIPLIIFGIGIFIYIKRNNL